MAKTIKKTSKVASTAKQSSYEVMFTRHSFSAFESPTGRNADGSVITRQIQATRRDQVEKRLVALEANASPLGASRKLNILRIVKVN
jgi:hypothetical protein